VNDLLDVIHAHHFPFPPATAEAIAAFEARVGWTLDEDLRAFYLRCNGAKLFSQRDSPYHILPLEKIERTRTAICGSDDPTFGPDAWWALADVQDANYVAVDLDRRDPRGCYAVRDIFHEVPFDAEYCKIICGSFGEFLAKALASDGKHFWLQGS
jgi:cell wall assembly regulator SMI1